MVIFHSYVKLPEGIPWISHETGAIPRIPSCQFPHGWATHSGKAAPIQGCKKRVPTIQFHVISCYIPISHVVSPYIIYTIQYMVNQRLIHIINPHLIHPQIHIDPHEYHHIPLDQLSQKHKKQHWKSLCFVHQIMIPDWSLPRCAWPPQSCTQRASVQRTSRRARWFHEFRREKAYETV